MRPIIGGSYRGIRDRDRQRIAGSPMTGLGWPITPRRWISGPNGSPDTGGTPTCPSLAGPTASLVTDVAPPNAFALAGPAHATMSRPAASYRLLLDDYP